MLLYLPGRESRSTLQAQSVQGNSEVQGSEVHLPGYPQPVTEPNLGPLVHAQ